MHNMHEMSGMLWSMVVLGAMPFLLVAMGAALYFRTQHHHPPPPPDGKK